MKMPATDYHIQLTKTVSTLEKHYPDSGYYAMDDTDIIYQKIGLFY